VTQAVGGMRGAFGRDVASHQNELDLVQDEQEIGEGLVDPDVKETGEGLLDLDEQETDVGSVVGFVETGEDSVEIGEDFEEIDEDFGVIDVNFEAGDHELMTDVHNHQD